jgi:hypothetical protein
MKHAFWTTNHQKQNGMIINKVKKIWQREKSATVRRFLLAREKIYIEKMFQKTAAQA